MITGIDQATPSGNGTEPGTVDSILVQTLGKLGKEFNNSQLEAALNEFAAEAVNLNVIQRPIARSAAADHLDQLGIRGGAKMVDAVFQSIVSSGGPDENAQIELSDIEPVEESVDGTKLLNGLEAWFSKYIYLPEHGAVVLAGWVVATWLIDVVYFAALLVFLSATKQCGKTLALDLLRLVVRRACTTSGVGITSAVVFRLNEQRHPTFLIDEAEKLGGRNADRELIGLLNAGYRRGARVQRCAERAGEIVIEDFDAFGFRALAAIGVVWDTLLDRSIVIKLERKPRNVERARFSERVVTEEGIAHARQIARWVADHSDEVRQAELHTPRPTWLGDRECDNWSTLFAVAQVAGGEWPEKMLKAAKVLRVNTDDEADHRERLIHDIRAVFKELKKPPVIKSGDLVNRLNEIETSPWGDFRGGDGLSAHKLAALLKPFEIKPDKKRPAGRDPVRGYWLESFEAVFARYPSRESVPSVSSVTSQEERESSANQSVARTAGRDTSNVTGGQEWDTLETVESSEKAGDGTVGTLPESPRSYEQEERLAIQEEGAA